MDSIEVRYKYNSQSYDGDLVCSLTQFMDKYLLFPKRNNYMCTYLYNDLTAHSTQNLLQIAFRYPGATRGSILLKRLDTNKFKIVGIHFNTDVCFEEFAIYDRELEKDIDIYIGRILDFSKVTLVNNYAEITY